jgi:hypothetical protein
LDDLILLVKGGGAEASAKLQLSREEKLQSLCPLQSFPDHQATWTPCQTFHEESAQIATTIAEEVCQMVRTIPFVRLFRLALGNSELFRSALISSFLELPSQIRTFLASYPDQDRKYHQVLEVCTSAHSAHILANIITDIK